MNTVVAQVTAAGEVGLRILVPRNWIVLTRAPMIDDSVLLQRLADENPMVALSDLYQRYADSVYGFGVRLFGDSRQAERLVELGFVELVAQGRRYDPANASGSRFIVSVVASVAQQLRAQRRTGSSANDVSQRVDDRAMQRLLVILAVDMGLQRLSGDRRELLRLAFMEKLDQRAIATRTDAPLGIVKTRALEALRELKSALEVAAVA